ncbi:helix-hairpin-helix domain-containing protein [Gordonia rubripertincta]|uniref:Helix-hairpin-helix domain-containing protein n=1 Tax=Gordonia rubripertincta TaxID=36822 RepID=A0AAW4G4K1_GORRU|nr:helix-hairpin-helix domain-containing protein [Gordonia rubripertincta]MBM7278347.1 helix-hairpin-helix domain-containing protein [Gordonia rubripertincta]MDG6779497.1 helix-hairpin-helix domain-containing protein [Gordonia rubripertincta]NKY62803.1 ComEA family DNA-binding protein [Gordonia rubripertincta]QMU18979.1 helix-hairpin-helix domain-containing protein [Gordonia rubripertincta]TSD98424.1 ComEA family DNA-binding protein [Gordonia rubripertincta]
MSASGRRNPLDRLGPVVESPARWDLSPAGAESDPPPGVGDPVAAAVVIEEPEHPGWGIGGMPTWLDAPPPSPPRRGRVGRFDDVLDPDDDSPGGDEDDDPIRRRRFAVAPPAAIALIAVGVIACVVAGFGLFRGTDTTPVVDFGAAGLSSTAAVSTPPVAAQPSTTPAQLVVSVVGLVNKPGLVRLAPGARVAEAIDHAGGPRKGADLLSLNLAQVLRDGDQVLVGYAGGEGQMSMRSAVVGAEGAVPAPGPSAGPGSPPPAPPAAAGGRVNLNTATETELDALPGVGPVTAKAILDWRERNGRFTSVDQLAEVDGIGPARLAKLRDLVTV